MPQCVDCGSEVPRDEMRGPPDELRCPKCAQKSYAMFEEPRVRRPRELPPVVTIVVLALSVIGTLIFWQQPAVVGFALVGPEVWDGELWRFATTAFLHGGWLHLLFNCYWLWVFGREVEAWMGPVLYAGFFLLAAAGASAAEWLVTGHAGVGLSGVVYALFGLLYALRRYKDFAAALMQPQIVQLMVIWFFVCIVLTYTHVMAVANVAHGAGCVLGWLVGQAVLARQRVVWLVATGLGVLVLLGATLYMPWNADYDLYRGDRAVQRQDYEGALYWYRKAETHYRDFPALQNQIRQLERITHPKEQSPRTPADEGD